jgi:hypothetical protein
MLQLNLNQLEPSKKLRGKTHRIFCFSADLLFKIINQQKN